MSKTLIPLTGISEQDLPARLKAKLGPEGTAAYVERFRIVATDPDFGPIIREEIDGKLLKRLSSPARRIAGLLLGVSPAVRLEVLSVINAADGAIAYPWPLALDPPAIPPVIEVPAEQDPPVLP